MRRRIGLLCVLGIFIFSGCKQKTAAVLEKPDDSVQVVESNVVSESELEDYEDTEPTLEDPGMTELPDNTVVDETESYSGEQLQQILSDVRTVLQDYTATIFTIDKGTKDYTSKLKEFYGTSEAFSTSDIEKLPNIYETLYEDGTVSTPETFTVKSLTMNTDTALPSARVIAVLHADFQNQTVKNQKCIITCAFDLLQEEETWKLLSTEIPSVYADTDDFQTGYRKGSSGKIIDMTGEKLYTYSL